MQERHQNIEQYFNEQALTTRKFVIPYINAYIPITEESKILEIGCGEADNLKPFLDMGCSCTGIDLDKGRIEEGIRRYQSHPNREKLNLIAEDIYKISHLNEVFDVIIIRDVVEHIPDQERFLNHVKTFLSPRGVVFVAFPPWQNPFGGHQQTVNNKFISRFPWIHLLPRRLYAQIAVWGKVDPDYLLEIKDTGLSLDTFFKIIKTNNYKIIDFTPYFINPNYETKFNLRPRKLWRAFNIPYLRNFYTTCGYFLLGR